MRALVLAAALTAACLPAAAGDLMYSNGSFTVRFTQTPCVIPAAETFLRQAAGGVPIKATVVREKGKPGTVRGCWLIDHDGDVWSVDEAGNGGFIPRGWLKEAPEA